MFKLHNLVNHRKNANVNVKVWRRCQIGALQNSSIFIALFMLWQNKKMSLSKKQKIKCQMAKAHQQSSLFISEKCFIFWYDIQNGTVCKK